MTNKLNNTLELLLILGIIIIVTLSVWPKKVTPRYIPPTQDDDMHTLLKSYNGMEVVK